MSNLSIENLSKVVQSGDTEAMFSPGGAAGAELRARTEMVKNGMQVSEPGAAGANAQTFSDMLRKSVEEVNQMQHQANQAIHELVAGRSKNIHETMLTIEKADTSLKLMMQVRNKVLDAYREIMRMQV